MVEAIQSEFKRTQSCEPCPKCGDGWVVIESERTQEFFGQVLPLPDLRKCDTCNWQEVVKL